jgi:hypothetical protein
LLAVSLDKSKIFDTACDPIAGRAYVSSDYLVRIEVDHMSLAALNAKRAHRQTV